MKFPRSRLWLTAGLFGLLAPLTAKEARKPAPTPAPSLSLAPASANADPLAHWLLQQDGQKEAIALPLGQVVHAATGKSVLPFYPKNASDVAFLTRLGTVMDRVLRLMNNPYSSAHAAVHLGDDEVAARFEEEIRTAVYEVAGLPPEESPEAIGRGYPALRLADAASGKTYYLAVTLYPSGKRGEARRALVFAPGDGARRITADGCCLLVGVEHNGKTGGEMAFLNWDVTDVGNLPVRVAVTFEGDAGDVYHPGAVLTDGRKGSD